MIVELIARPELVDADKVNQFRNRSRIDQLIGSDAEVLCEIAGRICYDSFGKGRSSIEYHQNILDSDHGSTLEHAQFSFHIADVSRNLTHELVRHRVGVAVSQRSTRYVDEGEARFIQHPLDNNLVDDFMIMCLKKYNDVVESLVAAGHDRKTARGAASRYLPNGVATELIWSANIRALRHVIKMRGSEYADQEIRILAGKLLEIMKAEAPAYFNDLEVKHAD